MENLVHSRTCPKPPSTRIIFCGLPNQSSICSWICRLGRTYWRRCLSAPQLGRIKQLGVRPICRFLYFHVWCLAGMMGRLGSAGTVSLSILRLASQGGLGPSQRGGPQADFLQSSQGPTSESSRDRGSNCVACGWLRLSVTWSHSLRYSLGWVVHKPIQPHVVDMETPPSEGSGARQSVVCLMMTTPNVRIRTGPAESKSRCALVRWAGALRGMLEDLVIGGIGFKPCVMWVKLFHLFESHFHHW